MRKHTMIPLPVYKTSGASLQKAQWRLIDPGTLSPWNVMSWGVRQLKAFVVGSDGESAPKLQVQELVLVENLQVCTSAGLLVRWDLSSDTNICLTGSSRVGC